MRAYLNFEIGEFAFVYGGRRAAISRAALLDGRLYVASRGPYGGYALVDVMEQCSIHSTLSEGYSARIAGNLSERNNTVPEKRIGLTSRPTGLPRDFTDLRLVPMPPTPDRRLRQLVALSHSKGVCIVQSDALLLSRVTAEPVERLDVGDKLSAFGAKGQVLTTFAFKDLLTAADGLHANEAAMA
jgi:hypothetical protein